MNDISGYISELISLGYSSLNREEGVDSLNSYKKIKKGLKHLRRNFYVKSKDINKCVTILKLLADIRENLIRSKDVLDSQIPNIYKPVEDLNKLLIKSANQTIKNDDNESITIQCEEFLKAADEIRRDKKLKGLGILDGSLKNVIGRLRKKSDIESVFKDETLDAYEVITARANEAIKTGELDEIGEQIIILKESIGDFEDSFTYRARLINYIRKYETHFIKKIKSRLNKLYKKSRETALFDTQEIIDKISSMEDLIYYHKNKGLNLYIKRLKNKIREEHFEPVMAHLATVKDFVLSGNQTPFWQDYEELYLKKNNENEIFSDTFYEYTLKGLTPKEASTLLKEKIQKLKKIRLDELKYIAFEQNFEKKLNGLNNFFEHHSKFN